MKCEICNRYVSVRERARSYYKLRVSNDNEVLFYGIHIYIDIFLPTINGYEKNFHSLPIFALPICIQQILNAKFQLRSVKF